MSDVSVLRDAVYTMPRIEKAQWEKLNVFVRWLVATRAAVLLMTFTSAAIAGLIAARDGLFDTKLFVLDAAGLVLAHATNNILNDLTDSARGLDKDNYFRTRYGTHPIEHGLMTKRQLGVYAAWTGLAAIACGAALVAVRGMPVVWLMLAGAFFVLFYTWPLKQIGLGEVAVILVWGPLMTGGSYYVITGNWPGVSMVASIPYALAATTVLFGKHIDKLAADRAKGVRTLPVILGEKLARGAVQWMVIGMYAVTLVLCLPEYLSPALLLSLGALGAAKLLFDAYRDPAPAIPPPEFPPEVWPLWFSAFSFHHTRRFGLLFLAALVIDVLWHRMHG